MYKQLTLLLFLFLDLFLVNSTFIYSIRTFEPSSITKCQVGEIIDFKNITSFYGKNITPFLISTTNNTYYPNLSVSAQPLSSITNTLLPRQVYERISVFSEIKEYFCIEHTLVSGSEQTFEINLSNQTKDFLFIIFGNVYGVSLDIITDSKIYNYQHGTIVNGKQTQQFIIWRPKDPISSFFLKYNIDFFEQCSCEKLYYAFLYTKDCLQNTK